MSKSAAAVCRIGYVLACVFLATSAWAETYTWKNVVLGGGGFVSGLITHPDAPGVVYARTDIGGVYRWNPADNSWIPLLDFAADANTYGIESVALDPSDSNRLYIAASRASSSLKWILVSTNQGTTFSSFTPPFALDGNARGRGGGERMAVDPNLGSILFYGTRGQGLYKSVDYGATWSPVATFPVSTTANTVGIVFVQFVKSSGTPGAATPVILAGVSQTGNNLYRSDNGGATWSVVSTVDSASYLPNHAAQDGSDSLYITFDDTCGPNDNVAAGAVCKLNLSTLASSDVSPVKQPGEQGGWGGVSVDAQHPTTLVVSTLDRWWPSPYDQIYRSTNGGASWKTTARSLPATGDSPWTVARTPHWCESVQIDPFNSDRAWYVTGYGIFSCTNLTAADSNGTVHWTFTSDDLEETVPLGLASPPSGPYLLSQVGDQGGFRHFNLDVSPPAADYFSTHRGTSYGIDFAENNPDIIVRLFSDAPYGGYSLDGGTTWNDFASTPPGTTGPGNIAVSADGSRIVWKPAGASAFYYSANNGATWTASTGGPNGTRS
ncbi:MAG TPA: sialidase family protein, partial [Verrucomicrobiae bacterium]|nr:sialidase family protein [Verrucomicrobiae bacterium]